MRDKNDLLTKYISPFMKYSSGVLRISLKIVDFFSTLSASLWLNSHHWPTTLKDMTQDRDKAELPKM